MQKIKAKKVLGVVLAGGQSRRMGQDKAFLPFEQNNLITYCLHRLRKQNIPVIINANGKQEIYQSFDLPIIADNQYGDALAKGPLGGLLASLTYCEKNGFDAIISVAVDTPFFPINLVDNFYSFQTEQDFIPVIAESENGLQPTFGFWPVSIRNQLKEYLLTDPKCKIRQFASHVNAQKYLFKSEQGLDPFFNINTPDDLLLANSFLNKE